MGKASTMFVSRAPRPVTRSRISHEQSRGQQASPRVDAAPAGSELHRQGALESKWSRSGVLLLVDLIPEIPRYDRPVL
jgi:hypothetical protein